MFLTRTAMFASPFGTSVAFLSMTGRETMGRPFIFEVDLLSDNDSLDLSELLAKRGRRDLERLDGTLREFNGLVTELSLLGEHGNFARYRAVLRPCAVVHRPEPQVPHLPEPDRARNRAGLCFASAA